MTPYARFHALLVGLALTGATLAITANPIIRYRVLTLFTDPVPYQSQCQVAANLVRDSAARRDQSVSPSEFESAISSQRPDQQPLLRYAARKAFREYRLLSPDEAAAAELALCRRAIHS